MKTIAQIKAGSVKSFIRCGLVGPPGEGKTYFAATFPKSCWIITSPGEEDTFLNVPALHKNIVGWEHFMPSLEESAGKMKLRLSKYIKEEVRPLVEKGECETVVVDNITMLAEYFWKRINEDEKHIYKTKNNEFDTRSAYGGLKDDLISFFIEELISLPCNLVVTMHLMLEDDDTMAKKPDKTVPYNAAILGGFRDKLQSLVSYMLYLERTTSGGKTTFNVRTMKSRGKPAKSRLQLPELIQDVSYAKLKQVIDSQQQQQTGGN